MPSLFEPCPNTPDAFDGFSKDEEGGDADDNDSVGGGGGGGRLTFEIDPRFYVLGTGRFSRVVWARRKQPWARAEGRVCALKVEFGSASASSRQSLCITSLCIPGKCR